jgi:Protein of unknown function (DUF2786)
MSTELQKIKVRIMALANKTIDRGCSEEEAMSAIEKIGELLEVYNLTMEECDVREEKCVSVNIPLRGARSGPAKAFARNLARLFSAKYYRTSEYTGEGYKRRAAYVFYVQQHDAEAVKYLFELMEKAVIHEAELYKATVEYRDAVDRRAATLDFQEGMAERFAERLDTIREESEAVMQAQKATGTALIVLKGKLVEEEFEKLGIKLRTTYSYGRSTSDDNARASGRAAADRVNLNRPVRGGGSSGYLLK